MQTKQQIQQLLASAGARPKKSIGQHFLIDLNLMRKLVDWADVCDTDVVLEVGCGTGSLTEALAECGAEVVAVELDNSLAAVAKTQLARKKNVTVINADVLENKKTINPAVVKALECVRRKCVGRMLLVANLPYNTASPVILNLATGATVADAMYVTVQKEVARRMTARPGGKDYGILSIFLAVTGEVKILRLLKPAVFWPARVDWAMVSFIRRPEKACPIQNMELFSRVTNLFMSHRRKMVKSCTKLAVGQLEEIEDWPAVFEYCSIDPAKRPEQLAPEDYIAIANRCWRLLHVKPD